MRSHFPRWVDAALVLLFVVFVAIVLGPSLIGRDLAIDVNLLTQFQPWRALNGLAVGATNVCRSDTVDSALPTLSMIRRTLYSGHYPTWNPYTVGGAPMASPNNGQFSPLALPYYVMPLWLAPAYIKLVEFGVILLGMVAFLRRLGLSLAAGVLGAIVFSASGFMIVWSNWPQTQVAALIPALLWATERLVQERRVRDAVPLALVVASMLLGGFPAVTGMALYLAGTYFLVRVVVLHHRAVREIGRRLLLAVAGLGVGVLLTAFQLVPFLEQLGQTDLTYRDAIKGNFAPLATLFTLVSPDSFGTCVGGEIQGGNSPIETIAFVGAAAVVLAGVAVLWSGGRSRRNLRATGVAGFFVVVTAGVVVVGWLGGPLLTALQHLPVFSNNSIWRIRSILGFAIAVLAAFGFERLVRHVSRPGSRHSGSRHSGGSGGSRHSGGSGGSAGSGGIPDEDRRATADRRPPPPVQPAPLRVLGRVVVLVASVGLGVETVLAARTTAITGGFYASMRDRIIVAVVLVVATIVLVIVVRLAPRIVAVAATLAVAGLVVGQSSSFGAVDLGGSDAKNFYPVTPTHAFLQAHLGEDRFAASNLMALPSTATYYGIRTPTGHQFTNPRWSDLLTAIDPKVALSATFSDFSSTALPLKAVGRAPLLDQLAVKYWLSPDVAPLGALSPPTAGDGSVPVDSTHPVTCTLPGGPMRAVVVNTAGPLVGSAGPGVSLSVTVRAADGTTVTGGRYLGPRVAAPAQVAIAVPGEDLAAAGSLTVTVLANGAATPVPLVTTGGTLACGSIGVADDGLKLVDSEPGTTIYQRLSSLPRIRWAGTTVIVPDMTKQVARMAAGLGPDTVLLASGAPSGPAPAGTGPARVTVDEDQGPIIRATVTAAAAGHLVVADSLQQPGWTATLDGKPAPLVAADHAFAAVAVPAGTHVVELSYDPPGLRLGVVLSLVGLIGLLALLLTRRLWPNTRTSRTARNARTSRTAAPRP